jgi:hypothetical protein
LIHAFKAGTDRFREATGFHVLCLATIYEIFANRFQSSPVHPHLNRSLQLNPTPIASAIEVKGLNDLLGRTENLKSKK